MKEGNKDWTCNLKATIIHHVMTCTKTYQKVSQYWDILKKACVRYFLFFYQLRARQKLWEMIFIPSKRFISFLRYLSFCISVLPFFSLCWSLLYDVINCLRTQELNNTFCFISWERKKVWHWNFVQEHIDGKSCRKYTLKASPWPLFSFG